MPDLKHVLDARRAALTPDAGGFDRLIRRRRHKEIRGRITAGVVALVVVAGGFLAASSIWGGARRVREGGVPIDRSSIGSLSVAWTAHVAGGATAPVVGDGLVFVGSKTEDRLYAFPQACESTCSPLWVAEAGSGQVLSTPVLLDGVVLVSSDRLYAFDEHCATTCRPLWTSARLPRPDGLSAPVVANGRVYVENGRYLYSFDPRCGTDAAICPARPVGTGGRGDSHYRSRDSAELVAGGDLVYVMWPDWSMSVFTTRCRNGGCPPVWNIAPVSSFRGSLLAFADNTLYVGANAYRSDCGVGGGCSPEWIGGLLGTTRSLYLTAEVTGLTVEDGTVYMAANRLYAFPEGCATDGATCAPAWVGPRQFDSVIATYRSWSTPIVSNGLVFAATDRLYAFAVGCGVRGATCRPLWVGPPSPAAVVSSVAVGGNRMFVASSDGQVRAYQATAAG